MSSLDPTTPKLSVDDILAFGDAELVQYMKENRGPDGGFDLPVEGWETLPKDHRDQFAERLRIGALKANDATQSRPVDLDQVAARLLGISDKSASTQAPSRPLRYERSPTRSPPPHEAEDSEIDYYNELAKEGGRPSYPIGLIDQVSQNPEEYREVLRPWQEWPDASTPDWMVFGKQLERWQDFHQWQQDNRGIRVDDDGFSAYTETRKRLAARRGGVWPGTTELELNELLKRGWENKQYLRRRDFHWLREGQSYGGFTEYVEAVKRRLVQHGFTRTFQLDEDPKRQDKLTTWIEYLNYEYSWYDRYTRMFKRLQLEYDEAWKKLVDAKVLRPFETDESLRSDGSGFQAEREEDQARKAVESAKSAAKLALIWANEARNDPRRYGPTKQERFRRLTAAESKLNAAKESLKAIKRRGDLIINFIRGTFPYKAAKRNIERQSILLRWILEQVSLIEAELKESDTAEGSSHAGCGRKRRLRGDREDEVTKDRTPKKQRRNDQIGSVSEGDRSPAQARETSKRSRRDDAADERPSKRCRNDSRDSNSQHRISGGTDATSIGGSQVSGPLVARRRDGDTKAALKTSKVPSNRPLRSTDISRSPAISQQLRRSPRIAARQDPSRIVVTSPYAVKISRQRSHRKIAQAPTPPSSAGSQERQSRSPVTKRAKGGGTKGGDDRRDPPGLWTECRHGARPAGSR